MGDDSGNWCELFHDKRDTLGGGSERNEAVRRRFRVPDSMGSMILELKVAACLLCADLGSSLEADGWKGGEEGMSVS